jgi:hypothetical protein
MAETAARNNRKITATITEEDAMTFLKKQSVALIAVVALIAGSVAAQHQGQHKEKFTPAQAQTLDARHVWILNAVLVLWPCLIEVSRRARREDS